MRILFIFLFIISCSFVPNAAAQEVTVTPDELDFGYVLVDDVVELEFTLENSYERFFPSVAVYPANADNFSLHWTGARAEAVRVMDVMRSICDAIMMFRMDYGEDPSSVRELLEEDYLEIPEPVHRNWSFTLIGSYPISQIETVSTDQMPDGAGRVIIFDVETGHFMGYGVPPGDPQEPLRVMDTFGSIYNSIRMFRQDNDHDPRSVEELIEEEYLIIPAGTMWKWDFTLIGSNPVAVIEAISTDGMFDGMGHVMQLDVETGDFSGYRLPYVEFYDWLWGGEWENESLTLLLTFQPDEERRFSSEVIIIVYEEDVDTLRIPVSGNGVLSVSEPPDDIPVGFTLQPAYPNPFNSSTTIQFGLPLPGMVDMTVWDIGGRRVATLVSGSYSAGRYEVTWDAASSPTGVYLIELRSKDFAAIRKVMLIR